MKKLLILLSLIISFAAISRAQTIVDQLEKAEEGKGTVTVTHSTEIDKLVNGTAASTAAQNKQTSVPVKLKTETTKSTLQPFTKQSNDKGQNRNSAPQKPDSTATDKGEEEPESAPKKETAHRPVTSTNIDTDTYGTDSRKKVMRNAHKVTGYRVQIYSGGSSRNDRANAQAAANKVKAKYPQLPVYVHFYSPSWKCRVGNFRSYDEANKVMKQMKALGYKQACIVKGQITVQ